MKFAFPLAEVGLISSAIQHLAERPRSVNVDAPMRWQQGGAEGSGAVVRDVKTFQLLDRFSVD